MGLADPTIFVLSPFVCLDFFFHLPNNKNCFHGVKLLASPLTTTRPYNLVSTMLVVAIWRRFIILVIAAARGTWLCKLLQIQILEELYERMIAGGGHANPFVASHRPRWSWHGRQQKHHHHQWQNKPLRHGHNTSSSYSLDLCLTQALNLHTLLSLAAS